jgi:hypothetical protein
LSNIAELPRGGAVAVSESQMLDVLRYDAASGLFYQAKSRRGVRAGDVAGCTRSDRYVIVRVLGKTHYAHRLAWFFTHGRWPSADVDHIDGDPSNNRIANLRDVSRAVNLQNQRRPHRSNKSSGQLGVSFDKQTGRWSAKVSVGNRTVNLGRHDSPDAAHAAYLIAKRDLHEGATI